MISLVYCTLVLAPVPIMLLPKIIVILMMFAILASLASALVFLLRDRGRTNTRHDPQRMVRALTWRIGLSITLFLLLMAGFYFGFIPSTGLSPR